LHRPDWLARDQCGGRYLRRSYSRADGCHAAEIDSVRRDKGLKTFFDRRNLAAGRPWVRAQEEAIGAAKAVIVLIGPRGLGSPDQSARRSGLSPPARDIRLKVQTDASVPIRPGIPTPVQWVSRS
jgi:hypothetical protein